MLKLRELRKNKGITMKELGKLVGVSEAAISQYETGKRQMSNEVLLRLGEFFDVSVGYLLGVESEKAPAPEGERKVSDDDIMFALWGDTKDMDKNDLEDVRRYAAFVRERKKK